MINKHFKTNLILTYSINAIVMGSGFILMFIINKYAGVHTYGELAIIISVSNVVGTLLTSRSTEAVTQFFVREKAYGNMSNAKLIVLIGISIDCILGIILILFFYLFSGTIALKLLGHLELAWIVWVYSFVVLFTSIRSSINGYFRSNEYFRVINFVSFLEAILKILFLFLSFFLLNCINLNYIVYSYTMASFIVTFFVFCIFIIRFCREFQGIRISKNIKLLKEYLLFNTKIFISTTFTSINNNIDIIILGYFNTSYIVGVYQTLKNLILPIAFISSPFAMLSSARLTYYHSIQNLQSFQKLLKNISILIFSSSLIFFIVALILKTILFNLFSIPIGYFYAYILLLCVILIKHSQIWWNGILINLYNPLKLINLSIAYFCIFQFILILWYIFCQIGIYAIVIANFMATIGMVVLSKKYYIKLINRDFYANIL